MHVGGEKELFSVVTSQNDVIWEAKRQSFCGYYLLGFSISCCVNFNNLVIC